MWKYYTYKYFIEFFISKTNILYRYSYHAIHRILLDENSHETERIDHAFDTFSQLFLILRNTRALFILNISPSFANVRNIKLLSQCILRALSYLYQRFLKTSELCMTTFLRENNSYLQKFSPSRISINVDQHHI